MTDAGNFSGDGVPFTAMFRTANGANGFFEPGAEVYLGGVSAEKLICWASFATEGACADPGCQLAHVLPGACGGRLREALGVLKPRKKRLDSAGVEVPCRYGAKCIWTHPSDAEVIAAVGSWWCEANDGREPEWSTKRDLETAESCRAVATASAGDGGRCKESAETLLKRLRKTAGPENPYVEALLNEPWLHEVLEDERLRRTFAARGAAKEITESYGALGRVRTLLARLGASVDGEGAVVFDVCSGRGLNGVLLSLTLPLAKVVMLDFNPEMDLSHVAARENLSFRHVDLFSRAAEDAIREESSGFAASILVGVHLCGSLSPRLVDLAFALPEVNGMILCPCCLKGKLGSDVARAARTRGVPNYTVLVETIRRLTEEGMETCGLCSVEAGGEKRVSVAADTFVKSPVNCFIVAAKS